ncbi:hydrolase [Streptomyces phage Satis]|nr:hydrolase [Streptomyces phage Satis]QBZ71994.1 hydrolase [Streptomyces phage Kradal]QPL14413.1 peptidase [Streptomyces phage EhyElimayoE]
MNRIQRTALAAASAILLTSGCGALHAAPISNAKANDNPAIEKINWYSPEQRAKEAKRQNRDADTVASSRSGNAAAVAIAYAESKKGIPYLWGGNGTKAQGGRFDCSGLTKAAYAKAGIKLPRVANDQYNASNNHPSWDELKPGDLVFFGQAGNSRSIHHVGIYIGDGKMVHAPRTGTLIRVNDVHYMPDYFGATRVA